MNKLLVNYINEAEYFNDYKWFDNRGEMLEWAANSPDIRVTAICEGQELSLEPVEIVTKYKVNINYD